MPVPQKPKVAQDCAAPWPKLIAALTGTSFQGEMLRLIEDPDRYLWPDAAPLIKDGFGLARTFGESPGV